MILGGTEVAAKFAAKAKSEAKFENDPLLL